MKVSARDVRATALGLFLLTVYASFVLATGKVEPGALAELFWTDFSSVFALTALAGLLLSLGVHFRRMRIAHPDDRVPSPLATFEDLLRARWQRDRLATLIWPPVMFAGLMSSFNAFKQHVLIDAGFHLDPDLARLDRLLFFGQDPWRLTHALFSEPWMTLLLDRAYHLWFVPMSFGVIICALLGEQSYRLRTQYLLSYMVVWIGLGSIMAWLLPSAGPCFYNDYVGPQASFAELGRQLQAVGALYGPDSLNSLDAQRLLRYAYGNEELIIGGGISAMPSVHNGVAALFVVAGFSISRKLGWAMSVYAFIIWLASIHLGWHYAVDGIVAIAATVVIWWAMGKVADRLERPLFEAFRASGDRPAAPMSAWWEHRGVLALLVLLSGAPLWFPDIPPLTDLPGHMGRYAVQLGLGPSTGFAQWYAFDWHWIGNLGVDILVHFVGPVLGVEGATKLVVIAIPMLTAAGFLAVAREVHGRVPPTTILALPLAYNFAFNWGFVNYALSMALAFLAFALWLRLGRLERFRMRAGLFAVLSLLLWTVHIFGWAILCVLAFSAELVRHARSQARWGLVPFHAGLACLPLALPFLPMVLLFAHGGSGGQPFGHTWFNWDQKSRWVGSILRDRWEWFDKASVIALQLAVLFAWARRRKTPQGLILGIAAVLMLLLYVLMPFALLGSAYADMRLAPFALATALLAVGMPRRDPRPLAIAALLFFGVRTVGTVWSFGLFDESFRRELAALDHVPEGARVLGLVGKHCETVWPSRRLDHLPSMVIVRRHGFANDQWQAAGAQLLSVTYKRAGAFGADPSQFVVESRCERIERMAFPRAIATFPRGAFDYVWAIYQPKEKADLSGLTPVWRGEYSVLYRVTTK